MLKALAESEWADEHEGDVIAAATERPLEEHSTPSSRSRRLGTRRRER